MSDQVLCFLLKAVKAGDLEVEDAVRLVRTAAQNESVAFKPLEYLVWKPIDVVQPTWSPPTWAPNTNPIWTTS